MALGKITAVWALPLMMLAFGTAMSHAQSPVIESISSTEQLGQGVRVRINGSEFGSGGAANLHHLWDTIDNQGAYSGISDGQAVPVGSSYPWESQSLSNPVVLDRSSNQRHSHSKAQYRSDGGNRSLGNPTGAGGSNALPETDEVFLSYWIKFDRDPYEVVDNAAHKLVRVWGGGPNDMRISWNTRGHVGIFNKDAGGTSSINGYSLINGEEIWDANTWHLHEMWVSSKDGIIESYVDGRLLNRVQSDDPKYLKRNHEDGPRIALIGFNPSHGEGHIYSTEYVMSDIAVLPSRGRVLLSSASNWSDSRAHEFQPATSWASNGIDIDLNYGALSVGANLYLYVVNPDGEVNEQGYALTKCLQCPSPISLEVLN